MLNFFIPKNILSVVPTSLIFIKYILIIFFIHVSHINGVEIRDKISSITEDLVRTNAAASDVFACLKSDMHENEYSQKKKPSYRTRK